MEPQVLDLAESLADAAGRVIRPYFRLPLTADLKLDESPVTRADREAEQAMRALIAQLYPHHGILGEEFGLENPDASWRWVLDPIDGTRAFITGRPLFGTLIGLLHAGVPVLGVIDQSATSPAMFGGAMHRFERLAGRVRRVSWGGDCYAYGLLALGQIDIIAERDMKPWDWAALVPIVEGAGGRVTDWAGRTLTYDSPGDVLAVGDPTLLNAAVAALAE